MYLIFMVLNDADLLEDLLIAWEANGVQGATVLFSTGMGRLRQMGGWRDDMPLMPSLRDFYEAPENMHRTIFTVADSEAQVDAIVSATKEVVGDLNEEGTGMLLILPVGRAYGVYRKP